MVYHDSNQFGEIAIKRHGDIDGKIKTLMLNTTRSITKTDVKKKERKKARLYEKISNARKFWQVNQQCWMAHVANMLCYKAEKAGCRVVSVNPKHRNAAIAEL
ncbi:MAG: hypothetical protein ACP5H8_02295 [Candidatus Micrarchaeia archaeon]